MNNYNFRIVVFFIFSNIFLIRGQQELSFNHYMFNSQLFNPAFVGLDENLSISSIHKQLRSQGVKIPIMVFYPQQHMMV